MPSETKIVKNGFVLDGSGRPGVQADVLIGGERILEIGDLGNVADAQAFDCTGLTVAPGFIDAHTHSDLQVLEHRHEKTRQGVTTEIVGNCGFSAFPPAPNPQDLRQFANGIFHGGETWGWPTSEAYLRAIERSAAVNAISLVGHGSLRVAVAGMRQGPLTPVDLDRMCGLLDEALSAGAAGFSTGLMYAPGSSAPMEELEALCRVVAKHQKIYATHMRSYSTGLLQSIDEQIRLAKSSGCRLQISHLQAVGTVNWPNQAPALRLIEDAAEDGVDIAFDCYPYLAGSTVLTQLLPQWALDGGTDAMLQRLQDSEQRRRIGDDILSSFVWRWSDIWISGTGSGRNRDAIGKNLAELSELRAQPPVAAVLDLIAEERGGVNMIAFNQSEDNLRLSLTHPLSIVISDGFYVSGRAHPRLYGTFPLLLGTISRRNGWLTLSEAVHKITQKPAERFRLKSLGTLQPGSWADMTVFDAAQVDSPATYEHPDLQPVGIHCVLRKGNVQEGALPGRG